MSLKLSSIAVALVMVLNFASSARADEYKVDPVHSMVVFNISHFGTGTIWGRFNEPAGTFSLDADAANTKFDLTVAVDKIDTANAKRDQHLKSNDFFNAAAHPNITFKSTAAKAGADGKIEVTGDLTIKGNTKSIVAQVTPGKVVKDPQGKTRVGITTSFTIKRSDYGVDFMPQGIGDEVTLHVALEGTR